MSLAESSIEDRIRILKEELERQREAYASLIDQVHLIDNQIDLKRLELYELEKLLDKKIIVEYPK